MARIDRPRIPPRPAGGAQRIDPVRAKARDIQRLHETPGGAGGAEAIERGTGGARAQEPHSIAAPDTDYLAPLMGMSRDRIIGSLTRIEHVIARMQEREGTDGTPDEMTLARMMIAEHLRRLRIVGAGDAGGPFGGPR